MNDGHVSEWALQDALTEIPTTKPAKEPKGISSIAETSKPITPGRKKSKDYPLIDYLTSDSGEAIIERLRKYLVSHPSAIQQALPYFELTSIIVPKI